MSVFANKLLIVTYHRVLGNEHRPDAGHLDRQTFDMHVDVLSRYFNVVALADAVAQIRNHDLPPRSVAITFDDGYRDNVTVALPVLEKYGVTATFFVASGYIDGGIMWNDIVIESVMRSNAESIGLEDLELGAHSLGSMTGRENAIREIIGRIKYRPEAARERLARDIAARLRVELPTDLMMQTKDIRALRDAGMEVGGHTRSHPILAAIPDDEAAANIRTGKLDLEQILGQEISSFAYPNGRPGSDYHGRHAEMVRNAGFELAVTTAPGCITTGADLFQLGRISLWHRSRPKLAVRMLLNYFQGTPVTVN